VTDLVGCDLAVVVGDLVGCGGGGYIAPSTFFCRRRHCHRRHRHRVTIRIFVIVFLNLEMVEGKENI
jgi:hypothetical protein